MKGSKLYNTNPALNKWEEENFARLMAKKIKGAKSVVSANKAPSSPSKAALRSSSSRSGSPAVGVRRTSVTSDSKQPQPASTQQPQQQPDAADAVAAAGAILGRLHELLQSPLLQQLQQLQLHAPTSSNASVQQPQLAGAAPQAAWYADQAAAADVQASTKAANLSLPSAASITAKQGAGASHAATNGTQGGSTTDSNSHGAAVSSPQELIRIAHAATALLQNTSPSTAAAGPVSASHAAAAAAVDVVTSCIAAGISTAAVGRPSSGDRQDHTSSKPGSSSGRKPKSNSRGSSRDDRRASKPQKAKPAWDEHWWESPLNESADGGNGGPAQQQQQQQQQQKKSRPGELIPARTTSPAVGFRATRQNGTSAAMGGSDQLAQGSSRTLQQQQPRMLAKQSSAQEGACSRAPTAAKPGGSAGQQGELAIAVQPRHQSGPNSKAAAVAALARLRAGSTTSTIGAVTGPGSAAAETDNEFKVKLLPIRAPAQGSHRCSTTESSNGEIQARQTAVDGIQQPGSRGSSAGGSQRFSEGTNASISTCTCSSPARYSNLEDADSPRSEAGTSLETAEALAADSNTGEGAQGAAAVEQHRDPAARAAAASPAEVDVLTSSLMTLNDLIRHKVKDLQQQQQQQQAPGQSMQQDLHHHHQQQQQHRGLGSDSGDLMGLSMQQSELLLMPGKADPLGMSDLAFLERGQQAYHTAESGNMHELQASQTADSGSMHELQRQQQPDTERLRPQHQQVASRGSYSKTLASAGATARVTAAAATAAEDDDMVLLGTLPSSFTAVPGATGLDVLYTTGNMMVTTARVPNTDTDRLKRQTVSDTGKQQGLKDAQKQQQRSVYASTSDECMLEDDSTRDVVVASGASPKFQVTDYAVDLRAGLDHDDEQSDDASAGDRAKAEGVEVCCEGSECSQPGGRTLQLEARTSQGDDYADDWEEGSRDGSEPVSENQQTHQAEQHYDKDRLHQLQQSVGLQRQAEQLTEGLHQLQLLVEGSRSQL